MAEERSVERVYDSPERVALELMQFIVKNNELTGINAVGKQFMIDLYVDCLWATKGNRSGGL